MVETMKSAEGLGLAAPQVGELKRIIAVQTPKGPQAFLNPEIIKKSKEKETLEEGCLCLPGVFLNVKRSKDVRVKLTDLEGNDLLISATGLMARIFQHETDHLNGVLFIDRLGFFQKIKFKLFGKRK